MELVRRNLKVRVAAAVMAAALLGLVGGFPSDGGSSTGSTVLGGYELQTHKDGHPKPPGCQKQHQYGKKPKQKCKNHP
ncbi:MAG: hypothetical protein M3271_10280 [Actinomycetota bacterium]|nr:hypothetical protein [Actinomycetota bacterium]